MIKKFWLWIILAICFCVSMFFAVSNIEIKQTQYQRQEQNQIQRNDNVQLTIIDTSKRYTNIYWSYYCNENIEDIFIFINENLDFFQQLNLKMLEGNKSIIIVYPIINSKNILYTNSNINTSSNNKTIKVRNFF